MVKAREVIVDALEDLVVQADEAPIEQSEANAALRLLNDMMMDWDVVGITLGYTYLVDLADELTVPLGAIRGIKANLALELAPKYNVPLSAELIRKAKEGYMTCVDLAVDMADTEYPGTLPRGSGNTAPDWFDNTFYTDQQETILTESGGSIALEDDTEPSS